MFPRKSISTKYNIITDSQAKKKTEASNFKDLTNFVETGNLEMIQKYFQDNEQPVNGEKKIDISDSDNTGLRSSTNTLLHTAIKYHKNDIVSYLITKQADVNKVNKLSQTPLHIAVLAKNVNAIGLLLEVSHIQLDLQDDHCKTSLHLAAKVNCIEGMKLLLDKKANVNLLDKHYKSPLHQAIYRKHVDAVKLLVLSGADANLKIPYRMDVAWSKEDLLTRLIELYKKDQIKMLSIIEIIVNESNISSDSLRHHYQSTSKKGLNEISKVIGNALNNRNEDLNNRAKAEAIAKREQSENTVSSEKKSAFGTVQESRSNLQAYQQESKVVMTPIMNDANIINNNYNDDLTILRKQLMTANTTMVDSILQVIADDRVTIKQLQDRIKTLELEVLSLRTGQVKTQTTSITNVNKVKPGSSSRLY